MQRMFNVMKWKRLTEGQALHFKNPRPRAVRLEVNARTRTGLYLDEKKDVVFLAVVDGRDTIEFFTQGEFTLVCDGDCMVYTIDGEYGHHVAVDPVIFTRLADRPSLAPELQAIQRAMQLNVERRLAQQQQDFERVLAEIQAQGSRPVLQRGRPVAAESADPALPVEPLAADSGDAGGDAGAPEKKRGKK